MFVALFKKMYVSHNQCVDMVAANSAVDARRLINKNMQLSSEKCNIDIVELLHKKIPSYALNVNSTEKCAEIVSVF